MYTASRVISSVIPKLRICGSDIRIGTVPCSTMSISVWLGGLVSNHTRIFSVTLADCEFANEKCALDGKNYA